MKRKILKILALVLALGLIIYVLAFANSLLGNPISYLLARSAAEKYLEDNHADDEYKVVEVGYNFKFANYYAHISSEKVKDGDFTVSVSMWGEVLGSDYSLMVTERQNVAWRLNEEYRGAVDSVLDGWELSDFISMSYGRLELLRAEEHAEYEGVGIMQGELSLGGIYNVSLLGAEAGIIVLYVDCDDVSDENAADILIQLKTVMNSAGVGFRKVDLILRHPPIDPDLPNNRPEGEISLRGFDFSDIYEDGMIDRVKAARAETERYYESLVGEKEQSDIK